MKLNLYTADGDLREFEVSNQSELHIAFNSMVKKGVYAAQNIDEFAKLSDPDRYYKALPSGTDIPIKEIERIWTEVPGCSIQFKKEDGTPDEEKCFLEVSTDEYSGDEDNLILFLEKQGETVVPDPAVEIPVRTLPEDWRFIEVRLKRRGGSWERHLWATRNVNNENFELDDTVTVHEKPL